MTLLEPQIRNGEKNDSLIVSVYTPEYKTLWDSFVAESKNGVFLFYRDFMEYHSDRFQDHSLLFFKNKKLVGLMPANLNGKTLQSHAGLTFGGIISGKEMSCSTMLQIFEKLVEHCENKGIKEIIYKTIPYIYHSSPTDEDLYALFRYNAKLIGRNASSAIYLPAKASFDSRRKESLRKAKKNNLTVKRSYDFEAFMELAGHVLMEKHGIRPVHSVGELKLLANRFPNNIKLFGSYSQNAMLAGIVIFESENVAHGQYAANSEMGRHIGAQDIIEDYLINNYYKDKKYYDFGISTLNLGAEINEGLLSRKEGFGARAITYDFYKLTVS